MHMQALCQQHSNVYAVCNAYDVMVGLFWLMRLTPLSVQSSTENEYIYMCRLLAAEP